VRYRLVILLERSNLEILKVYLNNFNGMIRSNSIEIARGVVNVFSLFVQIITTYTNVYFRTSKFSTFGSKIVLIA